MVDANNKRCVCGLTPAEFRASCVYARRLMDLVERASAHAGAETGEATCSCHMGAPYDPHSDTPRVRRAERLSEQAYELRRAHYAATRWAS